MKRFDLGMSVNYCPQWGVVEAIREFFQNSFDAQTANPENKMYFEYDEGAEVLRIGNRNGQLATNTLLLGQSTKTDDERMIGKHGEGYKVATVVLIRNGKTVTVYNRADREVWSAKKIKSRRYQAEVVVFDIEKVSIFKSVPDHDLIFEIGGITADDYSAIKASNLHLQDLSENSYVMAGESRILFDEAHRGKLYVGGLYVTTSKYANYGYDFEPSLIRLDRDRSFIDGLDLQFVCGKVICATHDMEMLEKCKDLWDGQYVHVYLSYGGFGEENLVAFYDSMYQKFKEANGDDAIPCVSVDDFNRLKRNGFNAVLVKPNEYHYVTCSASYAEPETTSDEEDLADRLENWFLAYVSSDSDGYEEGKELIEEVAERLRE